MAAAELAAEGVGAVVDHEQVVLVGDLADDVPVADPADEVRNQDCAGLGTDRRLDLVDADLVVGEADVDEDGRAVDVVDRGDVGGERQDRRDHLGAPRQLREAHRDHQRRRARVHHHAVLLAHELGDARLELVDLLPGNQAEGILHLAHHGVDLGLVEHGAAVADDSGLDSHGESFRGSGFGRRGLTEIDRADFDDAAAFDAGRAGEPREIADEPRDEVR